MNDDRDYSIYLVRCGDGRIYTGIATDVDRRLSEHARGVRGAKFLRGKGPLELIFEQSIGDRALASRLEYKVKQLPSVEKQNPARLQVSIDRILRDIRTP